jgi:hypothetical protein
MSLGDLGVGREDVVDPRPADVIASRALNDLRRFLFVGPFVVHLDRV